MSRMFMIPIQSMKFSCNPSNTDGIMLLGHDAMTVLVFNVPHCLFTYLFWFNDWTLCVLLIVFPGIILSTIALILPINNSSFSQSLTFL